MNVQSLISIPEPPSSAYFIVQSDAGNAVPVGAILANSAEEAIATANENLRSFGIRHYRAVSARRATDDDFSDE